MQFLARVLIAVAMTAEIPRPVLSKTIFHHLISKDIQQFGRCSLEETLDIFTDYPNNCSTAFNNLQIEIDSNRQDQATYQQIYSLVCSEECTDQIETFSVLCDAPQYTDPILHACE